MILSLNVMRRRIRPQFSLRQIKSSRADRNHDEHSSLTQSDEGRFLMSYASIMVSLDLGAAAADRVKLATSIANRYEARLTGVAALQVPGPLVINDIHDAERLIQVEEDRAREQLSLAKQLFARSTGKEVRTAWRSGLAEPLAYLVEQGRAADLLVVGRQGPEDGDPSPMSVAPGPLLMQVGRPVLVAPPGIESLPVGRIVVAWKDTIEARRAVLNSLPFLERADQVFVVAVGPEAHHEGAQDVADYLARHGIAVTTHLLPRPDNSAADEILRFAARHDAELIVMGAYGRSRLREWLFGGLTWELLNRTPVCCLMSH
jgi:nucleotide-binding universal stress UspA family protein